MNYALITGASKGMGKSMALILASRNYNLLLTARSEKDLQELKHTISDLYGVKAEYLVADLSVPGAAGQIKQWYTAGAYNISILINNAGYGLWGKFEELNIGEQLNMLYVNNTALIELTYLLLPDLKKHTSSFILNVASTAAYQAVPTLALYAASKAFVLSFTRALRYELKGTGISVSCLSPGPVDTGFSERAGMAALSHLTEKFNMLPGKVAETAIDGMFKGKAEIIPGLLNRITAAANRILPKSFIENTAGRLYRQK